MKVYFTLYGSKICYALQDITGESVFNWSVFILKWDIPVLPEVGDYFDWIHFINALPYSESVIDKLSIISERSVVKAKKWIVDSDTGKPCVSIWLDLGKAINKTDKQMVFLSELEEIKMFR